MSYPYQSITINNSEIPLDQIVRGTIAPRTLFEQNTFTFIKDWLQEKQNFKIQTSGSTGAPKLITISREQMVSSAMLTARVLGLQKNYYALVCLDTKYIGGQMMLVRSFNSGMKIIALDPSSNPLALLPHDATIDFAALVPLQIHQIIRSSHSARFNNINTIIVGGAEIDEKTESALQSFSCSFFATYGMTETISHIALRPLNGKARSSSFTTLPGIEIALDGRGCLVIDAPYLKEKVFTNDLVKITGKHAFEWLGRWDNIINSGGVKVMPEKIEKTIAEIFKNVGQKHQFFITSIPDTALGEKIALVIEGPPYPTATLETELMKVLSKYEVPKKILFVDTFTMTETGKINRNETKKSINL